MSLCEFPAHKKVHPWGAWAGVGSPVAIIATPSLLNELLKLISKVIVVINLPLHFCLQKDTPPPELQYVVLSVPFPVVYDKS